MFPSGISYEKLTEKTLEKSVNLLSYQFSHYEPMGVCLKTSPDDFKQLFRTVLQGSYDYTYIAREVATDQVIGVLAGNYFQTLFHRNFQGVLQEIIPDKLLPVADILGELEDTFVSRNPDCFTKTPYFYIYALAVAKKYVDSGISIKLSLHFTY